jgi:hypothetical protein
MNSDMQNSSTNRNKDVEIKQETLNTIRQYKNIDKAMIEQPYIEGSLGGKLKEGQMLDFSKMTKRNNFKPS